MNAKKKVLWTLVLTPGGGARRGRVTAKQLDDQNLPNGMYEMGWNWGDNKTNDVFLCELDEDCENPIQTLTRLAMEAL